MIFRTCLLISLMLMNLFPREEEAVIHFTTGRVELMRANSTQWTLVEKGMECGHNDKLYVHPKAMVILSFADGSKVFLKESSRAVINFWKNPQFSNSNKIITLEEGKGYFSFKKPLKNFQGQYNKVFGNTITAQTSEGGVMLEVDRNRKVNKVYVVSGVFKIVGSGNKPPFYMKSGNFLIAGANDSLSRSKKINEKSFLNNNIWIGKDFLENELFIGKLLQKRQQDIISGKILGVAIVMPFSTTKNIIEKWNISEFFTGFFAREASTIAYREIRQGGKLMDSPLEYGKIHQADRIVTGNIHVFDLRKKAVQDPLTRKYVLKLELEIQLDLQIIETSTEKVVREEQIKQTWIQSGSPSNNIRLLLEQPLSLENKIIQSSIVGTALSELKLRFIKFSKYSL